MTESDFEQETEAVTRRSVTAPRRIDPLTLITGIGALVVSAYVLLGSPVWVTSLAGRWGLSALAVVAGVALLVTALRPRRKSEAS